MNSNQYHPDDQKELFDLIPVKRANKMDNEYQKHSGGAKSKPTPQYLAAFAATLGAFGLGTVLGWSAPAGPRLIDGEYGFSISAGEEAWIASIATLGAAVICHPIGILMEKIGRKITMLLLVLPFMLGWILIITATNVWMLFVGRFLVGLAGGAFCVTAPAYNSEISQDDTRGTVGTFLELQMTLGILFVYALGGYVKIWIFSLICAIIPLVSGVAILLIPESPYFLVFRNRTQEAKKSLQWLRGSVFDCDEELEIIQRRIMEESRNPSTFIQKFSKKAPLKALIICLSLMLFQQYSGINAVTFNTDSIFQSAGSTLSPTVSSIIIGVIQFLATFVSTLTVERLGRKFLLLISSITMAICNTVLGVYFHYLEADPSSVKNITWLPLILLCVFVVAFSIGFGPIPWLVSGEICTPEIKAFVTSSTGAFSWLLAFVVTRTFVNMKNGLGMGGAFWFFGGVTFLGVVFVVICVKETKGKSLDEILNMFGYDIDNKV